MAERFWNKFGKKDENLKIEGLQQPKNFDDYTNLAIRRSNEAKEFSPQAQGQIIVRVPDDIVVNFISDVHAFHPTTNHERLRSELETIKKNKKSYVIFGGDLVEGIYWGGAGSGEMVGSLDEQKGFLKEMFKMMRGKTIGAVSGEHDSKWAAKTGADPYVDFTDLTKAPYKRGLLEIKIISGKEEYLGLVAHKLRGSSLYNNLHPSMRANREMPGYDFIFAGHTHRKGIALQPQRYAGGARTVAHGISGPYKEEDEYTQRSGWISQKTKQLYGFAVRLNPDTKRIEVDEDIVAANKRWA
jgi:predicted phosphodiesterase